jgi:Spy/CpxP family protein refolding chaperone
MDMQVKESAMFSTKFRILAGALLILSFAGTARGEASKDPAHERRWAKISEELRLTPEQRANLDKIRSEFRKTLPVKREAMESSQEDLQKALRGSATDGELRKKFTELAKRQGEFANLRFEKVLAIRALLTPEQREKFRGLEAPPPRQGEPPRGDR